MINIEEYIPEGYPNRISRSALQLTTGYTDREIRSAIEHSRAPIVSAEGGYFICTNSEQDLHYKRIYILQQRKRQKSIGDNLRRKFGG